MGKERMLLELMNMLVCRLCRSHPRFGGADGERILKLLFDPIQICHGGGCVPVRRARLANEFSVRDKIGVAQKSGE
ncbi:hypothetical protein C8R44DRAFT_815271 [Mycena epipterygia]|nr:hypothetical protein C8R44DRAFT_815271 [Mycena epipterygia]